MENDKQWHLDKRVPLALIGTLFLQTAALLIWGAKIDSRVEFLERQLTTMGPQAERIIRLETKMDSIFLSLAEIKTIVQRTP